MIQSRLRPGGSDLSIIARAKPIIGISTNNAEQLENQGTAMKKTVLQIGLAVGLTILATFRCRNSKLSVGNQGRVGGG
jgi:hypothetical protein